MVPVTARATILQAGAFRPDEGAVDPLVARRIRVLGEASPLLYRRPVELVRGEGCRLYDADGTAYLDAYNNVPSVGHAHPRVAAAIARQAATLTTHTRYLDQPLVAYAERLTALLPAPVSQVVFVCTGSEANDVAVRVARASTGGTGVIVTEDAYHGNTDLVTGLSPSLGVPTGRDVWTVPVPHPVRHPGRSFAAGVRAALASMAEAGVRPAALLVDSILSSDGVHDTVDLAEAVAAVRAAGGVLIADEVQPGFARTGTSFWGFARHGLVPELVTMGKPMGNGMPIAALAAVPEVLAPFARTVPYFNTFGGTQVAIAAAGAVLDVIEEEGLQAHAADVGAYLREDLRELAARHPVVVGVRGDGLFTGVELAAAPGSTEPGTRLAADVLNGLRERRVLTSVCGPFLDTLKVRPPLPFTRADADLLVETLDAVLGALPEG